MSLRTEPAQERVYCVTTGGRRYVGRIRRTAREQFPKHVRVKTRQPCAWHCPGADLKPVFHRPGQQGTHRLRIPTDLHQALALLSLGFLLYETGVINSGSCGRDDSVRRCPESCEHGALGTALSSPLPRPASPPEPTRLFGGPASSQLVDEPKSVHSGAGHLVSPSVRLSQGLGEGWGSPCWREKGEGRGA